MYFFSVILIYVSVKRFIVLMLCSGDNTDDQSLYGLGAVVDHHGLAGARGDDSFRGR